MCWSRSTKKRIKGIGFDKNISGFKSDKSGQVIIDRFEDMVTDIKRVDFINIFFFVAVCGMIGEEWKD